MKAIGDNDFMRNLEPVQCNEIVECMYERDFKKEQFVIREGGVGTQLYVISGRKMFIFSSFCFLGTSPILWKQP